ncbi:MAG: HAD family hydrolase [Anaerolineae bacterium]|nr:HAD family hydrolase [Anaerolineae bacterium]
MIKGIIFDLGGTLMEITRSWNDVIREGAEAMAEWYLKKRHIKFDTEALIDAFIIERYNACQESCNTHTEILAQESLRRALTHIAAPASTQAFTEAAIKVFFEPEENAYRLYDDALDTVKQLRGQGYRLGLYSNATDDKLIQRLVNRNHLRPHLSPTFSSAAYGWRKPKPELFNLIAERWKLPPDQIAMVGDTVEADILGALNTGMTGILIKREGKTNSSHVQPAATIDQLSELPSLLKQL